MADIRIRISAAELVYPSSTFPDLDAAVAATRAEIESDMNEYGGQVAVLHLRGSYDPDPEPELPTEPVPGDQVGRAG